ncbi:MAG: hypothetical protein ABIZ81_13550 [Opitutaceae bacterium]
MKKFFLFLLGTIVVLLLVVYVGGQFFLGSAVKAAVNEFGPKLTQTKVELASAKISPISGAGTLSGLFVGNPPGWTSDKAFYLGQVHVDIAPGSFFKDHIVINEVIIDQPEFVYETKLVASNIGDLMKNIEAATGGKKPDEPAAKDGKERKFEVKKFTLRNGKVTIGVGSATSTMSMPAIELVDIGTKEGGLTADQLASTIMRSVTSSVISGSTKALMNTIPTAGAAAGDALKKAGDGLKKMLGGEKQ